MSDFYSFIFSWVSLSIIGGLFTYRILNALLEYIIFPLAYISTDPKSKLSDLDFNYDVNTGFSVNPEKENNVVRLGSFIKELLIWLVFMVILFFISPKSGKFHSHD